MMIIFTNPVLCSEQRVLYATQPAPCQRGVAVACRPDNRDVISDTCYAMCPCDGQTCELLTFVKMSEQTDVAVCEINVLNGF